MSKSMWGSWSAWRKTRFAALGLAVTGFAAGAMGGCNDYVFEYVETDCVRQGEASVAVPAEQPADILLVIDNSGSMCEEQENLVKNFFDPACPINVDNVQPEYKNPTPQLVAQLTQQCGFVQILAAYDNDFRIGVISTDVGACDDRRDWAENPPSLDYVCGGAAGISPGWGRRPQRGCLQAPRTNGTDRDFLFLERGQPELGQKFTDILANVKTYGSAYERGLDAMEYFLDDNTADHAPGCAGDRDAFLRDNAKLVVIFLSDEEDCSHSDGATGFNGGVSETDGESCMVQFEPTPPTGAGRCYTESGFLTPVSRYSNFLQDKFGEEVSVAVIAGAGLNPDGSIDATSGCRIGMDGLPDTQCTPAQGSSNVTAPNTFCDPNGPNAPCCEADPGTRYFQLAQNLGAGRALSDSICFESFRETMVKIARFIARIEFLELSEPPASRGDVLVYRTRAGAEQRELLPRLPDGTDCVSDGTSCDGWLLDSDNTTIRFFGTALPGPGDELEVAFRASRDQASGSCTGAGPAGDTPDAGM